MRLDSPQGTVIGNHNIVFQNFVAGIDKLPTRHDRRIENFLTEYLGRRGHPVPFGGRDADLAALSSWLDDGNAAPYMLLTATAGRGKSALLVRWAQRLQEEPDTDVIFVPVSIRYRTNLSSVFFSSLAARLADVHGEALPAAATDTSADVWADVVLDRLGESPPRGRLVVILDGLDEAADWDPGPLLLPADPPAELRVVVSARITGELPTADEWLRLLGWDMAGLGTTRTLQALSRDGIRQVLDTVERGEARPEGPPGHAQEVSRLHELTEGDPLLLSLYLRDLADTGTELPRRPPGDLPVGLDGYFQRWWREQQSVWRTRFGALGAHTVEDQVSALMSVLACALGPLTEDDLGQLVDSGPAGRSITTGLAPVARFLAAGSDPEQGYVFSHSRLAEYWCARRMTPQQVRRTQDAITAWGLRTCSALEDGSLAPRAAPAYTVEYLAAHLRRSEAGPENWVRLLGEAREHAWLALEGSHAGFLSDVRHCREALHRAGVRAASRGQASPYAIDEVVCALAETSIANQARGISPELLGALVRRGEWTPVQALVHARQIPDPALSAAAVLAVARADRPTSRRAHAVEALEITARIVDDYDRDAALLTVLPAAAELGATVEALVSADLISSFPQHAAALSRAVPHLAPGQLPQLRDIAAEAQRWDEAPRMTIDWPSVRAGLVPCLPADGRQAAYDAILDLAYDLPTGTEAAAIWGTGLADVLPEARIPDLLCLARSTTPGSPDHTPIKRRVNLLGALAARVGPGLRRELVAEAVFAARIGAGFDGSAWDPTATALDQLMPDLPESLHTHALDTALGLSEEVARGQALEVLLPHLTGANHEAALRATHALDLAVPRAKGMAAAIGRADSPDRAGLALRSLHAARHSGDTVTWAQLLSEASRVLPRPELAGIVREALELPPCSQRSAAIAVVSAEYAHRGLDDVALETVLRVPDAFGRTEALLALAGTFVGEHAERLLAATVEAADTLGGLRLLTCLRYADLTDRPTARALVPLVLALPTPRSRAKGLVHLLPMLDGTLPANVLDTVKAGPTENDRALARTQLTALASGGHVGEALSLIHATTEPWRSTAVLGDIAEYLDENQAAAALTDLLQRADPRFTGTDVSKLVAVAPLLALPAVEQALRRMDSIDRASASLALATRWAHEGSTSPAMAVTENHGNHHWDMWQWMRWFRDVFPYLAPEVRSSLLPALPGCTPQGRGLTHLAVNPLLSELVHALPADSRAELYHLHTGGTLRPPLDALTLTILAPLLDEPARTRALDEVWWVTRPGPDDDPWRLETLRLGFVHLPAERRLEAGRELLAAAAALEPPPRTDVPGYHGDLRLGILAPHLGEDDVRRCLRLCRQLDRDRHPAVAELTARLARLRGVTEARAVTSESGPWDQAVLVAVSDEAAGDDWRPLLTEALDQARRIGDEHASLIWLATLASQAGPEDRPELTSRCLSIHRELDGLDARVATIDWLLPLLGHEQQRQLFAALSAESTGEGADPDTYTLAGLTEKMATSGHAEQALQSLSDIPVTSPVTSSDWESAFAAVVAVLPDELLDEATELARRHTRNAPTSGMVSAAVLATRRTGQAQEELFRFATDVAVGSSSDLRNILYRLSDAKSLSPTMVDRLLSLVGPGDRVDRWNAVDSLAPHMSVPQLEQVAAAALADLSVAERALTGLLPALCRAGRPETAIRLVEALREQGLGVQRWLFKNLAPLVPGALHHRLVVAARLQDDPSVRGELLSHLVPWVPARELTDLEQAAPCHPLLLAALARRADGSHARDLARQALDATRVDYMSQPLADIGDLLSPTEVAEAVVLIATHDPEGDLDDDDCAALRVLLRPPPSYSMQERYLVTHQILRDLFRTPRYISLYLIALLAPWMDMGVRHLFDTLSKVHHRWP